MTIKGGFLNHSATNARIQRRRHSHEKDESPMAKVDIVDMRELASPPRDLDPSGSALDVDYRIVLLKLATKTGSAGRVILERGDTRAAVEAAIKTAAIADELDVKSTYLGNAVYFYVNGPQPDEFLRQFKLRDSHAG
jgi:hypothetical protein